MYFPEHKQTGSTKYAEDYIYVPIISSRKKKGDENTKRQQVLLKTNAVKNKETN